MLTSWHNFRISFNTSVINAGLMYLTLISLLGEELILWICYIVFCKFFQPFHSLYSIRRADNCLVDLLQNFEKKVIRASIFFAGELFIFFITILVINRKTSKPRLSTTHKVLKQYDEFCGQNIISIKPAVLTSTFIRTFSATHP